MSRYAERSHKSEKKKITPNILSLGRLCINLSYCSLYICSLNFVKSGVQHLSGTLFETLFSR